MVRPSLRLVVAVLCATAVLVVAVSTFAVSYTISLATVRDLGRTQTLGLARTARLQAEAYFDRPVQDIEAMRKLFLHEGMDISSSLPNQSDPYVATKAFTLIATLLVQSNFSYNTTLGYIMDDGGGGAGFYPGDPGYHAFQWRHVAQWPAVNMTTWEWTINKLTGRQERLVRPEPIADGDYRPGVYPSIRTLARAANEGAWYGATLYHDGAGSGWGFPVFASVHNRTGGYIGIAVLIVGLHTISDFLRDVTSTTSGGEAFVVDRDLRLVASSHATPFSTVEEASQAAVVPEGCASSDGTAVYSNVRLIGCRTTAPQFPYGPLQAAAEIGEGTFVLTEVPDVRLLDTGGEAFFVASTPVSNRYRLFRLNVVLCVPESVVLGDIVAGRNIVLGITALIIVVAAGVSAAVVTVMLQPIADVSQRMSATARLREAGLVENLSAFTEIRRLQVAYGELNVALQSFTRYVPREVVKDLMQTGELCQIAMAPRTCTMLFCDIAGFTAICERVPLDVLSLIVTRFFERASSLVMRHGGLVDKFIGDCVMAVWGAPFAVENREVNAVLAAKLLDWETRNAELGQEWDAAGEALWIRVGIASGEVLAGNMGSRERMNYTVIGDAVNLASRLEGLNKQFDTRVIVDEITMLALRELFVLRLLVPVTVMGKAEEVMAYEVLGFAPGALASDTLRQLSTDSIDVRSMASGESYRTNRVTEGSSDATRCRTTADLVAAAHAATASSDEPLQCSPSEVDLAAQHSRAVQLYLKRDFATAFQALQDSTEAASVNRSRLTASRGGERAVELLMERCRQHLTPTSTPILK